MSNNNGFRQLRTSAFGEFLNQRAESLKAGAITKALDDVMPSHPGLDLTGHDFYDPEAIVEADGDLVRTVLGAPALPLLDSWRSS